MESLKQDWSKHSKEEIIEMFIELEAAYHDRGRSMRETGQMVRSLFVPKNRDLQEEVLNLKAKCRALSLQVDHWKMRVKALLGKHPHARDESIKTDLANLDRVMSLDYIWKTMER